MNDKLADMQHWLNKHGASIRVDGLKGPNTRAAIIETFRNTNAKAITDTDLVPLALRLGCTLRQIKAVAKVESAGGGWDDKGLLKCLWERHYLWRRIRFAIPVISNPSAGGYTIDADRDGINDSWEKLADAAMLYPVLAFEFASFGKFQIMGAHWKALGYESAREFVWLLSRDEYAHYEAFARYIETNGLLKALRKVDGNPENCRDIAKGYNGIGYSKFAYHQKIAVAWKAMR